MTVTMKMLFNMNHLFVFLLDCVFECNVFILEHQVFSYKLLILLHMLLHVIVHIIKFVSLIFDSIRHVLIALIVDGFRFILTIANCGIHVVIWLVFYTCVCADCFMRVLYGARINMQNVCILFGHVLSIL